MQTKCTFAMVAMLFAAPALVHAACGDGVRDGTEQCDGTDLGGETCTTLTAGFAQGGTLTCNADCTFNTTDCKRAFLESLIPSRGGANRCQLEFAVPGTTAVKTAPTKRQCSDGDGECDDDQSFNNQCTFRLQLCLNVPDPKVNGCPFISGPGKVFRIEVLQPKTPDVVQRVLTAATQLGTGAGVATNASGNAVSYSPPIQSFQCGGASLIVPTRGTPGHARPGKVKIKVRSSDNTGRVKAVGQLTLICNP
jgi:hypothetical protein